MTQEIIEIIRPIAEGPRGPHPMNILREIDLFRQVVKTYEWSILDVESKIEKRNIQFRLYSRWSFQERKDNKSDGGYQYIYLGKCINVYGLIQLLLQRIEDSFESKENSAMPVLVRFKALLLLEAYYINEHLMPRWHVPLYFFQEIQKNLLGSLDFDLEGFLNEYEALYSKWKEHIVTTPYLLGDLQT